MPSSIYDLKVKMYDLDSLVLSGKRQVYSDTFIEIRAMELATPLATSSATGSWDLPLSNQQHEITFIWEDKAQERMIKVAYQRVLVPIPPDCGSYEVYENLQVLSHEFDSVNLVKSNLEVGDEVHLEIFAKQQ